MNGKALIAEFIGTFALCFVGILAIHNVGPAGPAGLIAVALAHGLVIVCFATAFGAISGGHFNPAVTIAMLVAGKIKIGEAIGYILTQFAAGWVGALAVTALFTQGGSLIVAKGTPALGGGVTTTAGLIAEIIGTFFLVTVIFGTAVDRRAPKLGALAIGLVIAACILAIGPISGCAINPARFLGPALVGSAMENSWIYLLGPVVGGGLAGLLWSQIFEDKAAEAQ